LLAAQRSGAEGCDAMMAKWSGMWRMSETIGGISVIDECEKGIWNAVELSNP